MFFSETVRGMRPVLCTHVTDTNLFYSSRIRNLVAMATYGFCRPVMGKIEICCFCCLIRDIDFFFPEMFTIRLFTILYMTFR